MASDSSGESGSNAPGCKVFFDCIQKTKLKLKWMLLFLSGGTAYRNGIMEYNGCTSTEINIPTCQTSPPEAQIHEVAACDTAPGLCTEGELRHRDGRSGQYNACARDSDTTLMSYQSLNVSAKVVW